MNWQEIMYNRKGYVHHPDTPPGDKDFYIQHKETVRKLLHVGERFITREGVMAQRSLPRGKEELCVKSKLLHRGFYCPSPVLDVLITNSKRGRILVKPTERSHITNRYVYDTSNRLCFVDNYIDDIMVSSEYLIYEDNVIYGVTVGMNGALISVSEEQYLNERIKSYICAFYSGEEYKKRCYQMNYEEYHYDEQGLLDWDYYEIHYGWEDIAPSGFIKHNRYRFVREDGWLKSFTLVNNDGTPISGSVVEDIKIKRRA